MSPAHASAISARKSYCVAMFASRVYLVTMDLTDFETWILGRGRGEGTAKLYCHHVRKSLEHPRGYLGRLMDKSLAPKTRRSILAALRSWAAFKDDDKLTKSLKDIKLPPPDRLKPKFPLSREEWENLRVEIDESKRISEPMRAVLGMMASRGFRVGDVLRMRRIEVLRALDTDEVTFIAKGEKAIQWRIKNFRKYMKLLADSEKWDRVEDLISPGSDSYRRRAQATANVETALRTVAEDAGIDPDTIHPHRLRRTYAVHFLKELSDDPEGVLKLKEQMKWSDLNTAMQYLDHTRQEELSSVEDRLFDSKKPDK